MHMHSNASAWTMIVREVLQYNALYRYILGEFCEAVDHFDAEIALSYVV